MLLHGCFPRLVLLITICLNSITVYSQKLPPVPEIREGNTAISAMDFSRDGRFFATATSKGKIHLRSANDFSSIREFAPVSGILTKLNFSPDGKVIAALSDSGFLYIWKTDDARLLATIPNRLNPYEARNPVVSAFSFDVDGSILVSTQGDFLQRATPNNGYGLEQTLKNLLHPGIEFLQVGLDGKYFIQSSFNNGFEVCDGKRGVIKFRVPGNHGRITCINLSPSGKFVISGNEAGEIQLWDCEKGSKVLEVQAIPQASSTTARSVCITPDDKLIVAALSDGTTRTYSLTSGLEINAYESKPLSKITTSADGAYIALLIRGSIRFVSSSSPSKKISIAVAANSGTPSKKDTAAIKREGEGAGTADQQIPKLVIPYGHQFQISRSEFSPSGRFALTSDRQQSIMWDVRSGKPIHYFNFAFNLSLFADPSLSPGFMAEQSFSSGEKYLSGIDGQDLIVCSVETGQILKKLHHNYKIRKFLFSPDESTVITLDANHGDFKSDTVTAWDLQTGRRLIQNIEVPSPSSLPTSLDCNESVNGRLSGIKIKDVCIDGSGKMLIIACEDYLKYYDLKTYSFIKKVCIKSAANAVNTSFTSSEILVQSDGSEARFYRNGTGALMGARKIPVGSVKEIISYDAKYVLSQQDAKTEIIDLASNLVVKSFRTDSLSLIRFNRTNTRLMVAFKNHAFQIFTYPGLTLQNGPEAANLSDFGLYSLLKSKIEIPGSTPETLARFFRVADSMNNPMLADIVASLKGSNEMLLPAAGKFYNTILGRNIFENTLNITYPTPSSAQIINNASGRQFSQLESLVGISNNMQGFSANNLLAFRSNKNLFVFDVRNGNLKFLLPLKNEIVTGRFTPDGKMYALVTDSCNIEIWDLDSNRLYRKLVNPKAHKVTGFQRESIPFFSGKEFISLVEPDGTYIKWNLTSGRLSDQGLGMLHRNESHDGERVYFYSKTQKTAHLLTKSSSGSEVDMLFEPRSHFTDESQIIFLPDGKGLIGWNGQWAVYFKDASTNKPEIVIEDFTHQVFRQVSTSPDNHYLAVETNTGRGKIFDLQNGNLIFETEISSWQSLSQYNIRFSPDSKTVLMQNEDRIVVFGVEGKFQRQFSVEGAMQETDFPNDRITCYKNGQINVFKISTGKKWFTLVPFIDGNFVFVLPDGRYSGGKESIKKLSFVSGSQRFSFRQFDVGNNRPDLVLQALGCPDTLRVNLLARMHAKRLLKDNTQSSAISSSEKSSVELVVMNEENIPFDTDNGKLSLDISIEDKVSTPDRLNVWINEVPVFGTRGMAISGGQKKLRTSVAVTLSQGDNYIEVSAVNKQGRESYRHPIYVKYQPLHPQKSKVYFLGIGADHFADKFHNLNWSVKDIRDLASRFRALYGDDLEIDTFFNKSVTIEKIIALKEKFARSSVDDKIIISYSGHGLISKDLNYFLSTYDVDFCKPEVKGLPYEKIEWLLDGIPARKKLVMIDACHSGELDKDAFTGKEINCRAMDSLKRGGIVQNISGSKQDLKNTQELMQEIFVNTNNGVGATIIAAAIGTQSALEDRNLQNGIFTYCVLQAIRDNKAMTANQLKRLINTMVPKISKGQQQPTTRTENIEVDWQVW